MTDDPISVNVEVQTDSPSVDAGESSLREDVERHDDRLEEVSKNVNGLQEIVESLSEVTDKLTEMATDTDDPDEKPDTELDEYDERMYQ